MILYITAILLTILFTIPSFFMVIIRTWAKHRWGMFKVLNTNLVKQARAIDRLGNVMAAAMLNAALVKPGGHQHGNELETISKVLGVNKKRKKLTTTGKVVAWILNFIDEDHVEKASKNYNEIN